MPRSNRRVAIVTGASSGIGQAIAKALAKGGFEVFGFSRRTASPSKLIPVAVDVRNDESVAEGVRQVLNSSERIDVLVNAAGFSVIGAIEESSTAQAVSLFDTNVLGTIRVIRAVLPSMRAAGSGRIINIGSVVGFVPAPFMGIYAATKHAIEGYTESLDHEVRTLGIRASIIEPGFTRTGIAHATERADQPISVYARPDQIAYDHISKSLAEGMEPDIVGEFVAAVVNENNPKLRYPVASGDRLLSRLRRFVPASMFDKSLRKQFHLDEA